MNKLERFVNYLISWEGIILMFLAVVFLTLMGCSTKWEQNVGDYKATAHWGVEFEEKEDE
jgi:hypothetical protein